MQPSLLGDNLPLAQFCLGFISRRFNVKAKVPTINYLTHSLFFFVQKKKKKVKSKKIIDDMARLHLFTATNCTNITGEYTSIALEISISFFTFFVFLIALQLQSLAISRKIPSTQSPISASNIRTHTNMICVNT